MANDGTVLWLGIAGLAAVLYLAHAWRSGADWLVRTLIYLERKRNGLRSHRIRVGDLDFLYLSHATDAGDNDARPVLVLLHGFGGDSNHWLRIAPHLTRDFRLIIPDLPGFGETALPQHEPGNMEAQAVRVHAFIEALGIDSYVVAGNSMGAYLAATYAWMFPQRVRALWLIDPGGVHSAELTELLQTVADGGRNLLIPNTMDEFYQLRRKVFVRDVQLPSPIARAIVRRCIERRDLYERLFDELCYHSMPLDDLAHELSMPILLVWGDHDEVLHPAGADILASRLRRARTVIMSGIGHCPMIEAPEECASDFVQFVKSTIVSLTSPEATVHY